MRTLSRSADNFSGGTANLSSAQRDRTGHRPPAPLVAFERLDGAPLMSAQLAQDKAYSVCAFNGLPTGSGEAG
jgi:glc operon protein GlcG